MAQFRELLEDEGLPPNDERTEILLPVIRNLGTRKRRCCTALAESEIRLWWWPRYVRA